MSNIVEYDKSEITEYKLDTIENGIKLLTSNFKNINEISLAKLQVKEFGMSVILLGLAEKAAVRINKLQKVVEKLEDELFDSTLLSSLKDEEKVERYNLALDSITNSAAYIKSTISNINWNDIENRLIQLNQLQQSPEIDSNEIKDTISPDELKNIANKILSEPDFY